MVLPQKWRGLVEAPFKVSDRCCDVMKKEPLHRFVKESGRHPMTGVMADESDRREKQWIQSGCNAFNSGEPISMPLAFWTEQDVLRYLREFNVPYAPVYGEIVSAEPTLPGLEGFSSGELMTTGERRTGCMFCMYGVHLEKGCNRFQRMARTHPKQYDYCINKLGLGEVLDFIGVPYKIA